MVWHEEFPLLKRCTYVNTPGSGLLSKSLLDWRRQHDQFFFEEGSNFRIHQSDFLADVKQTVASFFHGDPQYTFLVPNFSFGFNTLLDGLDKQERFLLLQEDYPSVNFPVESRGFACHSLPIGEHLEERIAEAIIAFKPTVFAFSLVQYISGIKINLDFLKTIKKDYPEVLLIADGTQYCGTEPFDFTDSALDVLIASGYKWLLSGYGNGFILLKPQVKERLWQKAQAAPLPSAPFLQDKDRLSLYFEPGHQDTLVFGSLQLALKAFQALPFTQLAKDLQRLSQKAKEAFTERGLLHPAVAERPIHSSIFNLSLSTEKFQQLQLAKIICLQRGPGIRVGFHFYNSEVDLQKILQVIDA